jgi:hypothetical protein
MLRQWNCFLFVLTIVDMLLMFLLMVYISRIRRLWLLLLLDVPLLHLRVDRGGLLDVGHSSTWET